MPPSARKLYEMPKARPAALMKGRKVWIIYDPNEAGGGLEDMVRAVFSSEELAKRYVYDSIDEHNADVMEPDEVERLKRSFDEGDYPYARVAEFGIDDEVDG